MPAPKKVANGERFNRWVVLREVESQNKRRMFLCVCDCGTEREVMLGNLTQGLSTSCGCFRIERTIEANTVHGGRYSKTYDVWCSMVQRCTNTKNDAYANYGGRGIFVCERWHSYEHFLADMGECPDGMTVERIDNDGPYSPENTHWASRNDNNRNRRNTRMMTAFGQTKPMMEWAEEYGLLYSTLYSRIYRGLAPEDALRNQLRWEE